MARPTRAERAGALYHVTNRGISHRPLFETAADVNCFLGLLGEQTGPNGLEVHAFTVLATHFHLLLRSRLGLMAGHLQRALGLYARWFNRTRSRDGHAFKGRYHAREVSDHVYLAFVVAYIDRNALEAGIVDHPAAFPFGSARYYTGASAPPWLSMDIVRRLVCRIAGKETFRPEMYATLWIACSNGVPSSFVGRAMASAHMDVAPISVLVRSGPEYVQQWLRERTLLEEGRARPCLVLPTEAVIGLARRTMEILQARQGSGHGAGPPLRSLTAGLLYGVAGLSLAEIGDVLGISSSSAHRDLYTHVAFLERDAEYGHLLARELGTALRTAYGSLAGVGWEKGV